MLPEETRRALQNLAGNPRAEVAVISGRALDDIQRKVGLPGIFYAGNHGLELEGPGLRFVYPPAEAQRPVIRRLAATLRRALSGFEGVLLEDKGITLSVHHRLAAEEQVSQVRRICEEAVAGPRSRSQVRMTEGKKVYEIRPGVVWDKEDAIALLLSIWSPSSEAPDGVPFFLGDDLTDEGGFRLVNARGGVSVFVGPPGRETAAGWRLISPDEVLSFLGRLAAEM